MPLPPKLVDWIGRDSPWEPWRKLGTRWHGVHRPPSRGVTHRDQGRVAYFFFLGCPRGDKPLLNLISPYRQSLREHHGPLSLRGGLLFLSSNGQAWLVDTMGSWTHWGVSSLNNADWRSVYWCLSLLSYLSEERQAGSELTLAELVTMNTFWLFEDWASSSIHITHTSYESPAIIKRCHTSPVL